MAERVANVLTSADGTITTLAAQASMGSTTITTAAPAPDALHNGEFRIRIGDELALVTGGQDGTSWTVERGVENSAAATHAAGARVRHILTADALRATTATAPVVVTRVSDVDPDPGDYPANTQWTRGAF